MAARRAGRFVRAGAARRAAREQAAARTYFLDLDRLGHLQDQRNTPFTPSVHASYALVEALRELADEGGWRARHARYAALAEQGCAALAERGIGSGLAAGAVVGGAARVPPAARHRVSAIA